MAKFDEHRITVLGPNSTGVRPLSLMASDVGRSFDRFVRRLWHKIAVIALSYEQHETVGSQMKTASYNSVSSSSSAAAVEASGWCLLNAAYFDRYGQTETERRTWNSSSV